MKIFEDHKPVKVEVDFSGSKSLAAFGDIIRDAPAIFRHGIATLSTEKGKASENIIGMFPADYEGNPTGKPIAIFREPVLEILLTAYLTDRDPRLAPIAGPDAVGSEKKNPLRLAAYNGKTVH